MATGTPEGTETVHLFEGLGSGRGDSTIDTEVGGTLGDRTGEELVFELGHTINGRYRVDGLLGTGGMGRAYRVVDLLHPERKVALKTIRTAAASPSDVEQFKTEFRTMAKLSHPNVARIYDFEPIRDRAEHLFTLELVEGQPISDACRNADWPAILAAAVQLARALAYMHSRRVIHFDLKPQNVLLTADGVLKVLDLGIAGAKPLARRGALLGTPAYMAPEVFQDPASVDHRYDIYGFGIILYELVCQRLPFPTKTLVDALFGEITFDEDTRQRVPPWLLDVIRICCAKRPADRFSNANAIIEFANEQGGLDLPIETEETRESYLLSGAFVGRDHEMERVMDFIGARLGETAPPATPAVAAFVTGESGLGKSRLMREVRLRAQFGRSAFLEADCYENADDEYGPIAELLGHAVSLALSVGATDLLEKHAGAILKLAPAIGKLISTSTTWQPSLGALSMWGEAQIDQIAMVDEVVRFLSGVAEFVPLVLYVNDLQWARVGTVRVLATLYDGIRYYESLGRRVPIALLGSYREDEIEGRPIAMLVANPDRAPAASRVSLSPLASDDVGMLLKSMLGISAIPSAFVDRVVDEAIGNPYFVESILRVLVETGNVYLEQGRWAATAEVGALEIPRISEVFLRRVSMLDATPRALLEVFAVVGMPVGLDLVGAASRLSGDVLHQAVQTLIQRGLLLRQQGDGQRLYAVAHDRMREGVHAALGEAERKRLHLAVATSMEELGRPNLEQHYAQLADHYCQTDDQAKALDFCTLAGRRAKASYANEQVIRFFGAALPLTSDRTLVREFEEGIGDAHSLTGKWDPAFELYRKLRDTSSGTYERIRFQRKMAEVRYQQGRHQETDGFLWDAVKLLGHAKPAGKARVQAATVAALGKHLLQDKLPFLCEKYRDPNTQARQREVAGLYMRLVYAHAVHQPEYLPMVVLKAAGIADKLEDCTEAAQSYSCMAFFYSNSGNLAQAEKYYKKCIAVSERIGSRWHLGLARVHLTVGYYLVGQFEHGAEIGLAGYQILRPLGDLFEIGNCMLYSSMSLRALGRLRETLGYHDDVLAFLKRSGGHFYEIILAVTRATVLAMLGHDSESEQAIDQMDVIQTLRADVFAAAMAAEAAEALYETGRIDKALVYLDHVDRMARGMGQDLPCGAPRHWLRAGCLMTRLAHTAGGERRVPRQLLRDIDLSSRAAVKTSRRIGAVRTAALCTLGKQAWLEGHRDDAVNYFELALQDAEARKAKTHVARTQIEAARLLQEGSPRHRDIGKRYAQRAVQAYGALGMTETKRKAAEELC